MLQIIIECNEGKQGENRFLEHVQNCEMLVTLLNFRAPKNIFWSDWNGDKHHMN